MNIFLDMESDYNLDYLKEPAQIIKSGGVVIFPTETIYGIGTNGLDAEAVKKIYKLKGRSFENPINLLVSSTDMIEKITYDITPLEYKLMEEFFPGPLTIILKRKPIIPDIVTSGNDTVGIRMPSGEIARKLVELSGVPIAAPSANLSGKPSGTNLNAITSDFSNRVDYIINGGESTLGIESTIIKVIDNIPHILRPGSITPEQIKNISGSVVVEDLNSNSNLPSAKLKHYQLSCESILIYSDDNNKMVNRINELTKKYTNPLIICSTENKKSYKSNSVISFGSRENLQEISKNIFSILRNAEKISADIIIIEGVKKQGLGIAIMNRLLNVCNYNYEEIN